MGPCISGQNKQKKYVDNNNSHLHGNQNYPPYKQQLVVKQNLNQQKNTNNDKLIKTPFYNHNKNIDSKDTIINNNSEYYSNLLTQSHYSSSPSPRKQKQLPRILSKQSNNPTKFNLKLNKKLSQQQHTKQDNEDSTKFIQQQKRIVQILNKNKHIKHVYKKVCQKMNKYNNDNGRN